MIQLKILSKADSITGTSASKVRRLQEGILKEAKNIVDAEICRKIIAPLLKVPPLEAPPAVLLKDAVEVRLAAGSDAEASKIAKAVVSKASWLVLKEQAKKKDGSEWTFNLNPKEFERQLAALKKFGKDDASLALLQTIIRLSFCKEQKSAKIAEKPSASALKEGSLSLSAFGISVGKPYTKSALDKAVEASIQKMGAAIPVVNAVFSLAHSKHESYAMVAHPMSSRDTARAEKELLPLVSAVSVLHSNPKLSVVFNGESGFILYYGKRPVGRMGKDMKDGLLLKDAIKLCEAECGKYGNSSVLLDVLDAEGKRKEERLAELFNDLAKHIKIHSSGPAARAARLLANAAGINGIPDWNAFSKVIGDAAEEIRAHRTHPFIASLKDAVSEMNKGRGVLDLWKIKWEADIVQGSLDWLGAIIADVLEDEAMKNSRAVQALSSTVDWLENKVHCALSMKYQGSAGIRVAFKPCTMHIAPKKWRLQLQDIMKSGPKWSEF